MDQRLVGLSFAQGLGSLTVTGPPNGNTAPPGYYMLFILNSLGVPSVAKFVQLGTAQSDFSVSATPDTQTVAAGESASYTVNIAASNGFTGTVSFEVSGLPQDAAANFSPDTVAGSGSTTLTIDTLASTPPGTYPLTITATSGNLTHVTNVTLVVNALADFSISATPPSRTVNRGSETRYRVTITGQGGFGGTVNLSVTGLPAKTLAAFSPKSITGAGSATLRVKVAPRAAPGTYTLTITGISGSLSHSTTVSLIIQ
jgi:uncharacterized membrane protein